MENKEVKVCADDVPQKFVHVLFNEDVSLETAEELMDAIIAWVEARGLTIFGEVGIAPSATDEEKAELEAFWKNADAESEAGNEAS